MKLRSICAIAAIAFASTGVHAASFGELSVAPKANLALYSTPVFFDTIDFSLGSLSTVYVDTKVSSGTGGFFGLFSGVTPIGSPYLLGNSASFSGLAAGSYKFGYFGVGGGLSAVAFAANAVPAVPEPESYAMLLAGLGMVAAIARRRRRI